MISIDPQITYDNNLEGNFTAVWNLSDKVVENRKISQGTNGQNGNNNTDFFFTGEGTSGNNLSLLQDREVFIIRNEKPIKYIKNLTSISEKISGDTQHFDIIKQWRSSSDGIEFSDWKEFSTSTSGIEEFDWNWLDDFYIEFKFIALEKAPSDQPPLPYPEYKPTICVEQIQIQGVTEIKRSNGVFTLEKPGDCLIKSPQDRWKVFKLNDVIIVSGGENQNRILETYIRYSFSNGRVWSDWEILNKHNLRTIKVKPTRFFNFEVSFCRKGSDKSGDIKIYDIMFKGDFQNVTADYYSSERLGLRSECRNEYLTCHEEENEVDYTDVIWDQISENSTFNPYRTSKAVDLYELLTKTVSDKFGFRVTYFKTDPDLKGADPVFHEYQLYNVVEQCDMNILIPKNEFPDNKVAFNTFDLAMFNTFEVHITREEFKKTFGEHYRPGRWDYIFLCDTNRLYQIEHVQPQKDFMNQSVYYVAMLKKYDQNQHIKHESPITEETIENLTENTSLDDMFDDEVQEEYDDISNKPQTQNKTQQITGENKSQENEDHTIASNYEYLKREIAGNTRVVEEPIENSNLQIADAYYDLTDLSSNQFGVSYNGGDNKIIKGENRSLAFWFKFNELKTSKLYTLIENRSNMEGYRIIFQDGRFDLEINNQFYELPASVIKAGIWYAMLINIDQRIEELRWSLWKRQNEDNPNAAPDTMLNKVTGGKEKITQFSWDNNLRFKLGNGIKMTNIRVWSELIPENSVHKVLNEYIVKNSSNLLIADNAYQPMNLKKKKLF